MVYKLYKLWTHTVQCKTTKSPAPSPTVGMATLLALGMVKKSRNVGCKNQRKMLYDVGSYACLKESSHLSA